MFRSIIVVLCIGGALSAAVDREYDINEDPPGPYTGDDVPLSERIKTIHEILLKYDRDLDRLVPFKEIREALQGLDIMTTNYTGNSRNNIFNASGFGYQATDNYFRGTDKIVAWCASASRVFKYIVKHHADLPQDKIKRTIRLQLNKGLITLRDSISSLETVVHQLSAMERSLRPVPDSLNKELKELQIEHRQAVARKRKIKMFIQTAFTAVGILVGFIISFYLGPIGGGLIGVGIKVALSQIPNAVIEGRQIPTMEEKLRIVEAYYLTLIQTVQHAGVNVTNVRSELDKRIQFVDMELKASGTKVEADDEKETDTRVDRAEAARIVAELQDFLTTIDEMKARHMPPRRGRRMINPRVNNWMKNAEYKTLPYWSGVSLEDAFNLEMLPFSTQSIMI